MRNRQQTDALVAQAFGFLTGEEARQALTRADIGFASLNDMAALSAHPHLRQVTVDTPGGPVTLPAPAPIVIDTPRRYGPVPALGG